MTLSHFLPCFPSMIWFPGIPLHGMSFFSLGNWESKGKIWNIWKIIPRTCCFHIFGPGSPVFFFPAAGVLGKVAWYCMLWCDATQSTVSRVLVWRKIIIQVGRFPAPQERLNLSFLEISSMGFPARFAPIPAWDLFNTIAYSAEVVFFCAMHTGSCWRLYLYQPHFTPFDPLQLQHMFRLPKGAKIA